MSSGAKGFAGLRQLRSNLDDEALRLTSAPHVDPSVGPATSNQRASQYVPVPQSDGTLKAIGIIACLIVAGLVVVWFANSNSADSTRPYDDAGPYGAPAADATVAANLPPAAPAYIEPEPRRVVEVRPQAGSGNRLSANEIAYCMAENVRMSAAQSLLLSGGSSSDIADFNYRVEDYNSRCSDYQYMPNDRAAAERYIDINATSLRQDGERRVQGDQSADFPVAGGDSSAANGEAQ